MCSLFWDAFLHITNGQSDYLSYCSLTSVALASRNSACAWCANNACSIHTSKQQLATMNVLHLNKVSVNKIADHLGRSALNEHTPWRTYPHNRIHLHLVAILLGTSEAAFHLSPFRSPVRILSLFSTRSLCFEGIYLYFCVFRQESVLLYEKDASSFSSCSSYCVWIITDLTLLLFSI